ncbi:MAG: extracellular solute-binding protein, partial [Lachnospiraceae bacterium]|nr:extracellular solute-binding protein [Lachnospiraceae bacterium]
MKKKWLATIVSMALAGSLMACGGSSSGGGTSTDSQSAQGDEAISCDLTVWTPQEDQDEENGNWIKTECEAFAAEHKNWDIHFTYEVCGEGNAYLTIKDDPEKAADVYLFAADQIPNLVSANAISELGGDTLEQIKADNPQGILDAVTFEDAVYAVPFTSNNWFMFYNKNIFSEEDVKSLDTMLEKAKVAVPVSNSWSGGCFYLSNGCTMFGEDGTDEEAGIDFGGEKGVQVTDYLVDLVANKNFINDADGAGMAGLTDGSVGAIFSGNWDYENAAEAVGGVENLGIAVPPTIQIDGSDVQLTPLASAKAIGVNPNCEHPEVAVRLAAYLGGKEGQTAHYEMRNVIPSITDIDVSTDEMAIVQQETQE